MKTLNTIATALSAVAFMGTAGLFAQTAVANIPFEFTAQRTQLPAGQYELKTVSPTSGAIQLINLESGKSSLVLAPRCMTDKVGSETQTGKVIFHRYGDRYFFSEVWTPNGPQGRVGISKVEAELRASGGEKMASVRVPLSTQ